MKTGMKLLTAATLLLGLTAGAGSAATISLNGTDYEMSTMNGALNDNRDLLEAQVWWGDQGLALDFATAWGANSDLLVGASSPVFAFRDLGPVFGVTQYLTDSDSAGTFNSSGSRVLDFAVVTSFAPTNAVSAVPLPAGGILLLTGLVGFLGLRQRTKRDHSCLQSKV